MEACEEFQFRAPWLQFTQDGSKARIRWQAQGAIVAAHKQHMVNSVGKSDRTWLYSSWMPSAEAKRKLETALADLQQNGYLKQNWLNMYDDHVDNDGDDDHRHHLLLVLRLLLLLLLLKTNRALLVTCSFYGTFAGVTGVILLLFRSRSAQRFVHQITQ